VAAVSECRRRWCEIQQLRNHAVKRPRPGVLRSTFANCREFDAGVGKPFDNSREACFFDQRGGFDCVEPPGFPVFLFRPVIELAFHPEREDAHLLKLQGWPHTEAGDHWRNEVATFQVDAIARYAPSMRQRIDLPRACELAQRQIAPMRRGDRTGLPAPATCPVNLDQLLAASVEDLEAAFTSQPAG
jgi:hypothetical protein